MIDRIGGWPRPLTCTTRDALYCRSSSCPNISIESIPKMVVKRVGMSTTPLGMYLQIKNHHEQHPKIEWHLQCAHRKDFKKPRGTDWTNENLCWQDRFGGGDSSSKSPADLFIVTVLEVTYARTASKWHLFGETAHFIPSPRCSVCLDTVQLVRTCLERGWKPRL